MEETYDQEILPFLRSSPYRTQPAVFFELIEDVCFPVRLQILHVLDTEIYRPAVVRFTESLCISIAEAYIFQEPEDRDDIATELHDRFSTRLSQAINELFLEIRQNNKVQLAQIATIFDARAMIKMDLQKMMKRYTHHRVRSNSIHLSICFSHSIRRQL